VGRPNRACKAQPQAAVQSSDQLLAFRPRDVKFLADDVIMKNDRYRTLIMEKSDLQDIPMPRTIIIATYLVLLEFTLLLGPVDTAAWLGLEAGPVENAGAISFLLAGAVFLVTAYRSSEFHRRYGASHMESPLALLALGALCLVCFGEEIGWGQRLFDYSVPAWLEGINRQGEWNLQNLAWFHAKTAEGAAKSFWDRPISMVQFLAFFQLTLCTMVPLLTAYSATLRTWGARIGLPIVPWWIAGLVPTQFLITQVLSAAIGEQPIGGNTLGENKESVQAFIFLVVALWAYRRTTARPSVAASDRPEDSVRPKVKTESLASTHRTTPLRPGTSRVSWKEDQ
jgi:hypothetical protein